jgi:hypothetical protein
MVLPVPAFPVILPQKQSFKENKHPIPVEFQLAKLKISNKSF